MKKRKFKAVAVVLALALAVTGIPFSAYAWSWGIGSGSGSSLLSSDSTAEGVSVLSAKSGTDGAAASAKAGYSKKYNKIVAMGDNTVAGLGLEGFDNNFKSILTLSNAKNSNKYCYPRVLADYLQGSLISNLGNSALTTIGLYAALTGTSSSLNSTLSGIDMEETYYNIFVNYGEICDADLITLQVGFNELLFGIVMELMAIEGVPEVVGTELCQTVISGGSLKDVIWAFVKTMRSKTDKAVFEKAITEMVNILQDANLEKIIDMSIVTVSEYLPRVVDAIHDLNPNADIALVGYYNPYKISNIKSVNYRKYAKILANPVEAVKLFLDEAAVAEMFSELDYPAAAFLLDDVLEKAVTKANSYIEKCAADDPKVVYIDVTDIYKNPSLSVYPDKQGHIDIADRILDGVISEVTVRTTGAAATAETKVVTSLANNKPEAEKAVTSLKGNTSAKVAVRFGEPLRLDLGASGKAVKITVDGKQAEAASNFYLTGSASDRTVEISYSVAQGSTADRSYGVNYYYYPAYSDEAVGIDTMMNSLDLKAYDGVGYMLPEAPAGLSKLAPTGKMFGGWCVGDTRTVRQPGEVITDINGAAAIYVNWIDDPDYDDGAASYSVTVEGGVTVDGGTAYKAGDRVYVYAAAHEGSFDKWVSANENLVIADSTSTCAYFFMPGEAVSITATWKAGGADAADDTDYEAGEMPYTDVAAADWFYDGAKYCYEHRIMKGVSDTLFGPNAATTRAMVVTMLYRMEGSPDVTAINSFADVKASDYFYDAVRWADEKGIVTGEAYNVFNPNGAVTREQLASMLFRYAKYKGDDVSFNSLIYSFADASMVSDYALDALGWANYNGIVTGVTIDRLEPQGSAARAQVATMIKRFSTL